MIEIHSLEAPTMRLVLAAASIVALAACSSHKAASTSHDPHPNVVLASDGGAGHCSSKKVEMASMEGDAKKSCSMKKAEMASAEGAAAHCSGKKVEMASMEGDAKKSCSMKKAEMASAEGGKKECSSKKVEMASMDGDAKKSCSMKKAQMASSEGAGHCSSKKAEMAAADAAAPAATTVASAGHAGCDDCPMKADGTCDHEAGAKAGRECCKAQLAATATP